MSRIMHKSESLNPLIYSPTGRDREVHGGGHAHNKFAMLTSSRNRLFAIKCCCTCNCIVILIKFTSNWWLYRSHSFVVVVDWPIGKWLRGAANFNQAADYCLSAGCCAHSVRMENAMCAALKFKFANHLWLHSVLDSGLDCCWRFLILELSG